MEQEPVIAITHDRYFLDNVAGWILELDQGHGIPWKGNYSDYEADLKKDWEKPPINHIGLNTGN
ncbi:MAG: hypothetical protein ACE5KZ_12610 [Candidatus Scalinduaceae bacterium]